MRLPTLTVIKQTTDGVTSFSGYDHRKKSNESAFYDMMNMSSEALPVMSTRRKRGYVRTLEKPNGLFAHDALCWVDGTEFYYGGEVKGTVEDSPKTFIRMGAQVLIWPDEAYYNAQTGEFGQLGAAYKSQGVVSYALCRLDGTPYEDYTMSETAPEKPENGQLWMDTSVKPNVLKYYAGNLSMWESIPTVYTKIRAEGIGGGFAAGDGVTLGGFANEALNGSFYLVECEADHVIVVALIQEAQSQEAPVTMAREIPQMDYLMEHDNRIWGCSNAKHEIYACALGDAKNWNQFMGIASDSYAVTVGTSGEFTGCCAHQGNVLFFKENTIHTIMGTKPANYQLDTTECRGVMKGCHKSLKTVNETLLFKNRYDVCRFGSTLPSAVSDALGGVSYGEAVAGAMNGRYYLCMQDEQGCAHLFVYDTTTGAWVKEDHADVMDFAAVEGYLYMLLRNGEIWCADGMGEEKYRDEAAHMEGVTGLETENAPEWMLETGDIGLNEPNNRYVKGIQLHAQCELGTMVRMEIRCDDEPGWEHVLTCAPATRRSLTIPYVPKRCRTLRIRLSGKGEFSLYSIVKRTEVGSDVYGAG